MYLMIIFLIYLRIFNIFSIALNFVYLLYYFIF